MPRFRVGLVPDFSERHDRSVVEGVSRFVHETGSWSLYVPPDPQHRISMLRQWRGDGIIANFDDPQVVELVKRKQLPAVGFGGGTGFTAKRVHYLATDDDAIGRLGARHLLERGLRHFSFCAMPLTHRNQPWSQRRAEAFSNEIEQAGYSCSTFRANEKVSADWELLLTELSEWLRGLPKPVGVMAAYDLRALHVVEACRQIGLRVPDDVAVLGVDNDEQVCELGVPPLSSIVQGGAQIGYQAATLLQRLMRGESLPRGSVRLIPPVEVVTRHSTDTLAVDDPEVALALRYIRDKACDGIQVRDVVRQATISRATLEKRFQQIVGRTMHKEIKRFQLERVKMLLRTTDLSIHQISDRTGFEYPEYLSTFFHRAVGQTLGQYRSEFRSSN